MSTTIPKAAEAPHLLARLEAVLTIGVPVRVKADGLRHLARMEPLGVRILDRCVAVLTGINERKRYWPLLDLPMVERAIAEQCFPDAPCTVPDHMRDAPEWLTEAPITSPTAAITLQ